MIFAQYLTVQYNSFELLLLNPLEWLWLCFFFHEQSAIWLLMGASILSGFMLFCWTKQILNFTLNCRLFLKIQSCIRILPSQCLHERKLPDIKLYSSIFEKQVLVVCVLTFSVGYGLHLSEMPLIGHSEFEKSKFQKLLKVSWPGSAPKDLKFTGFNRPEFVLTSCHEHQDWESLGA